MIGPLRKQGNQREGKGGKKAPKILKRVCLGVWEGKTRFFRERGRGGGRVPRGPHSAGACSCREGPSVWGGRPGGRRRGAGGGGEGGGRGGPRRGEKERKKRGEEGRILGGGREKGLWDGPKGEREKVFF